MKEHIIGIDIGGTHIRIGAVNRKNEAIAFDKILQQDVFTGESSLDSLISLIRRFLIKYKLEETVEGISIGFPSTLNRERTKVLQTPNIKGMDNLDVVESLEDELKVPVIIDKDVTMALYYDRNKYQIPDSEMIVGCYIGTGIGNVILINGRLITGKDGVACELGHVPLFGDEQPCGCGNKGCLENKAGGKYLAQLCKKEWPGFPVSKIFSKKMKDVRVQTYLNYIAIAVSIEINILNPDYIIIGGGVPSMESFPRTLLEAKIREHARKPYPEQGLQLVWADDTDEKGVIGAALFGRKRLKEESLL